METGTIELMAKGSKPKPYCRPLINKPAALDRDYNRDPNIKALKRRGSINHGSTFGFRLHWG